MTDLIIRYRACHDVETERKISEIEFEAPTSINAFCHLRNERRSFVIARIVYAADAETGEIVDVVAKFGITLPAPPEQPPLLRTAEEMRLLRRGTEEYKRQRNKEKRELMKPFQLEVIYQCVKDRLFGLFDDRCAKCRRRASLDLDHHVPMTLGGRLVPGNLGVLCRSCNNAKSDVAPRDFYSDEKLSWIEAMLAQEQALFAFKFDWNHWHKDRKGYLGSVGIEASLADEVLCNRNHRWYIHPPTTVGVRLEVLGVQDMAEEQGTQLTVRTHVLKDT
jgi:hypothetical protein